MSDLPFVRALVSLCRQHRASISSRKPWAHGSVVSLTIGTHTPATSLRVDYARIDGEGLTYPDGQRREAMLVVEQMQPAVCNGPHGNEEDCPVHGAEIRAARRAFPRRIELAREGRMDFGDAIRALKQGRRVARQGWNGKGMWLALSPGSTALPAEKFWAGPNRQYAEQNGGTADVLPCVTMKVASGEILMGWLASQSDMLAEDWTVVDGEVTSG